MSSEEHDEGLTSTSGNLAASVEGSVDQTDQPAPRWSLVKTLLWGVLIFGIYSIVQIIGVMAYMVVAGMADGGKDVDYEAISSNGMLLSVCTIMAAAVCVPLVMGVIRIKKGADLRAYLGLRGVSLRTMILWLIGVGVAFALSDLIAVALDRPVVHDSMREAYRTAGSVWLLWLAVVVAAPVFEEIFYRGFVLYGLLGSRLGVAGAIVITAFAWAIVHVQYGVFEIAVIFVMGILLGVARLRTGSILVPIAMHMANNLVSMIQTALDVAQ